MVAYNFQKRFVPHIQAGLEPGPWLPGMKRHTLRLPRSGRSRHARPEEALQLYTDQRSKRAWKIGNAVCRLQMPVMLVWDCGELSITRREGAVPRSSIMRLAPIVRRILEAPIGKHFVGDDMDEFARTDGFGEREEMAAFFEVPAEDEASRIELVLIGWSPVEVPA